MPKPLNENPETTIRRAAMDYLARREHSFHELEQKLSEKYPDLAEQGLIAPAITRLREENLQSDARFLESYIRHRKNKGFGPLKIEAELYHKGVDAGLLREYLYAEENDWLSMCRLALRKRFPLFDRESVKEKQRCQRFLMQRGFGSDDIYEVIKG